VVQSSPFSGKQPARPLPDDATILIHGINDYQFDPARHRLVSAASCTTTALAHMMRPLLERELTRNMITAGMSTVHAATNSQPLLDAVPAAGATDLRKTRGALGNVVLTSTNAAAALEQVMPEIGRIGFMADSVRIPTASVSLIILNVTFRNEALPDGTVVVEREAVNGIYQEAAQGEARGLLKYSDEQNVSLDMLGENAAVVIEGVETHTRTGFIDLEVPAQQPGAATHVHTVRVPLTHVKIFGWYDNEMGSYTYRLGELTTNVARHM
jgi:glyceraldehyde 3-phosphate dehydrogenase